MRHARITREGAFSRSVEAVKSLEERRDEKMARTVEAMKSQTEHDKQASRENLQKIHDWLPNEVKEWKAKESAYNKAIEYQLKGDPASIERTVPNFIY